MLKINKKNIINLKDKVLSVAKNAVMMTQNVNIKIKKENIFFGDVDRYVTDYTGTVEDISAIGKNGMYVTDMEHTLLIKCGDHYINLTCIRNGMELVSLLLDNNDNNDISKQTGKSVSEMEQLLNDDRYAHTEENILMGNPLSEAQDYCTKVDTLIPYDDSIAEYYGVKVNNGDSLSYGQCKKISNRCTREHVIEEISSKHM